MDRDKAVFYDYKESRFCLQGIGWYTRKDEYEIVGIKPKGESLYLPDTYNGKLITEWREEKSKSSFPSVRFLFIPASITEIDIPNSLFPNLERIEVQEGNIEYATDGRMLFCGEGRELQYSLAIGNMERAVIPKMVRKIKKGAFEGTLCREIIFENPEVSVEAGAFCNSKWLEQQRDFCVIGNMFYRLMQQVDVLKVPENIRRFHEDAFMSYVPSYMITPVIPRRNNFSNTRSYYSMERTLKELTVTRAKATINFRNLGELLNLENIFIDTEHEKYISVDGVIFSKDKKCLMFYPRGKEDRIYKIPEGTVKIAREAFSGQRYLQEVWMPDTITTIGMSAFYDCAALQKVLFSENIREIPDSSAYQKGGVFQECKNLCEVKLPAKLQYLGSFAFYNSGLEKVVIGEELRQIGEYAFSECKKLNHICLPQALERLGKGALRCIESIEAYVGTAKGLVSAVNTVPPDTAEKSANVNWGRCTVYVKQKDGEETELFLIPGSLKRNSAYHLDMAWNNDTIDYEEYDTCFEHITSAEERLAFAELGILRLSEAEEDTPYISYMKHSALKIATHLLEERKEKEFLAFLERGYLSESAFGKLLKLANANGLTTCSAYLLEHRGKKGTKRTRRITL